MKVHLMLFAAARTAVGKDRVQLEVPEPASVDCLLQALREQYPETASLIAGCAVAVDGRYATPTQPVASGAEVALIPPVSGG